MFNEHEHGVRACARIGRVRKAKKKNRPAVSYCIIMPRTHARARALAYTHIL